MRGIPFWTLILISSAVSLLMIKQIFLSRAIIREQHVLVDYHEVADTDATYTQAWEKLALMAYKSSAKDPAMIQFLKSEGVGIHEGPPPGTTLPDGPKPTGAPSAATSTATLPGGLTH